MRWQDEIWKDIYFIENGVEYDYRGLYQVSNFGRVKSLKRKYLMPNGGYKFLQEKILKMIKNKDDYFKVALSKTGKRKDFLIHRLVSHMFIDGYFDGAEVNHIDENKENNHVSNLEWMTHEKNCNHGTRVERILKTKKELKK